MKEEKGYYEKISQALASFRQH